MFRGFYTAATGMLTHQRRTEMLTNNLANVNTPGFKTEQASLRAFPEMLLQQMGYSTVPTGIGNGNGINSPFNKTVGSTSTGVYMQEAIPNFLQGDMRQTELNTDIAIIDIRMPTNEETGHQGTVFFTIQNAEGEPRYTRNGNFTLDGSGFLTTASGNYVLDGGGNPIQLASDQFTVRDDGTIEGANGERATLGIAFSEDPLRLIKEGDGLYRTENDAPLAGAFGQAQVEFKLQQGFLERSNVDPGRTMTELLSAYRSFEANQKVLQAYDRSMDKAVNEVGRIR